MPEKLEKKLTPTDKFNILVDSIRWEIEHSTDAASRSRLRGALIMFDVPMKK